MDIKTVAIYQLTTYKQKVSKMRPYKDIDKHY